MNAYLVAGLGFGDEGKGSIVDSLVRHTAATLVVRYNGGAQAAHHVVLSDGREHCFSQFGSGTLAGARTFLSKYTFVEPFAFDAEAEHLKQLGVADPYSMVTIDPQATIITRVHRYANQHRERLERHGSCGFGFGEAVRCGLAGNSITVGDLLARSPFIIATYLEYLHSYYVDEIGLPAIPADTLLADAKDYCEWASRMNVGPMPQADTVIFEGAQGVLLDQDLTEFYPHVTWSKTTFANAFRLLPEGRHHVTTIGVTRAYHTRHGAGPFIEAPVEFRAALRAGDHNVHNEWQGDFRVGPLDPMLLHKAIDYIGGVDYLAVTCVDRAENAYGKAWTRELMKLLQERAPIGIISNGPTENDKQYLLASASKPVTRSEILKFTGDPWDLLRISNGG